VIGTIPQQLACLDTYLHRLGAAHVLLASTHLSISAVPRISQNPTYNFYRQTIHRIKETQSDKKLQVSYNLQLHNTMTTVKEYSE